MQHQNDETYQRFLKLITLNEMLCREDPGLVSRDPKLRGLLERTTQCSYLDIAERARNLLQPKAAPAPKESGKKQAIKRWWQFWKPNTNTPANLPATATARETPAGRHMLPLEQQSEHWMIAVTSYQETRMKIIPGGWNKQDAYPVMDGFLAMSAEEILGILKRIPEGSDAKTSILQIEKEVVAIARTASGERVVPS
jgi:hypothetical protein